MRALERDSKGLRRCRIDEWASVSDAPTATPGRMALDSYVCRGLADLETAIEYANHISDAFEELGAPHQVFVVTGPTSTTRKPFEVVNATAGYSVLHVTRPTWGKTLSRLLAAMTRETRVSGLVPDPVAQDILSSAYVAGLEHQLRRLEIGRLEDARPLGGGLSSVALQLGDWVIRIGRGELPDRPPIPEVLQADVRGTLGNLRFELLPRADTKAVTAEHLHLLIQNLASKGYEWGDAGMDNIGLVDGRPVIFDSDVVREASTEGDQATFARDRVRGLIP